MNKFQKNRFETAKPILNEISKLAETYGIDMVKYSCRKWLEYHNQFIKLNKEKKQAEEKLKKLENKIESITLNSLTI